MEVATEAEEEEEEEEEVPDSPIAAPAVEAAADKDEDADGDELEEEVVNSPRAEAHDPLVGREADGLLLLLPGRLLVVVVRLLSELEGRSGVPFAEEEEEEGGLSLTSAEAALVAGEVALSSVAVDGLPPVTLDDATELLLPLLNRDRKENRPPPAAPVEGARGRTTTAGAAMAAVTSSAEMEGGITAAAREGRGSAGITEGAPMAEGD